LLSPEPVMNNDGAPGFRPLDIATIIYAFSQAVIVAIFMSNHPGWYFLSAFYLAACGIALVFALFQKYGVTKILRIIYPLIIIPLLYEALSTQILIFHSHSFDSQIVSFEHRIFGFEPSFILQRYMTIGLNEVMSLFYMYYYILPFLALILLIKRRWDTVERTVLGVSVTFYICYIIFILYPVLGPRFYLESIYYLPLIGQFFTPLAIRIVSSGGLQGGAMPSSHCAVALVFTWFLIKEFKSFRWPMVFLLVMLCFSTVYGRYHYVIDVVVGLLVGAISILLTSWWQDRFLTAKEKAVSALDIKNSETVGIGV
jgi:membrane-associated phospholipid phosphatase